LDKSNGCDGFSVAEVDSLEVRERNMAGSSGAFIISLEMVKRHQGDFSGYRQGKLTQKKTSWVLQGSLELVMEMEQNSES
jgi:hypothetical protein